MEEIERAQGKRGQLCLLEIQVRSYEDDRRIPLDWVWAERVDGRWSLVAVGAAHPDRR